MAAWATGIVAISIWGFANIAATLSAREDLVRFEAARDAHLRPPAPIAPMAAPDAVVAPGAPLAILRIPKIQLEVAVLPGTSFAVLNRGAGHISHTALPGSPGNSGIAGHRDGVFRGLKAIARGDAIVLETLTGRQLYLVERTWIVDPDQVAVLDPTAGRALTLVTCYPFQFVGLAPKRFIVRAVAAGDAESRNLSQ